MLLGKIFVDDVKVFGLGSFCMTDCVGAHYLVYLHYKRL